MFLLGLVPVALERYGEQKICQARSPLGTNHERIRAANQAS